MDIISSNFIIDGASCLTLVWLCVDACALHTVTMKNKIPDTENELSFSVEEWQRLFLGIYFDRKNKKNQF